METIKKYKLIIVLIIGFILGCLMTCSTKNHPAEVRTIKTDTIYKYITRVDTFKIDNPIVTYKDKPILITNTDTILKEFSPKQYEYTYKDKIDSKSKRTQLDVDIKGWGDITSMSFNMTEKDTIKTIYTKETITKTVTPSTLFLGASFDSEMKPGLNVDYSIKGKVLLGTQVQYNPMTNKPLIGGKIGIKF